MTTADALLDAGVSEREAEVLALVGDHLTNAEISARLYISVRTVESHVSSLLRKLGVGDRRALAELAAEQAGTAVDPATPAATAAGLTAAATAAPVHTAALLPSPLTSFVGRAAERAALAEAVQQHRLVTAVGPGGVGKTRLALAVVGDVADRFADGVWYVDLVPVTDPAMIAASVAAALGAGEQSGRSIEDTVIGRLAGARALVVLDNAEHLVDGVVVFVERLLRACPQVAVLATSRARLLVPFEWTFPVGGLSIDGDADTDETEGGDEAAGDAVALFVERAAAVGGAPPGADERRRIAAICRDLDGMALAIELAAARLPTLGLDGLEAGLADQLQLLAGGHRLDDRHRSLRTMLDWSCALLDEADRTVLWRMSLFASPFTADAAAALLAPEAGAGAGPRHGPSVAATLARLADQSLLVVAAGPGGTRYRMLETIRQYGTAQLTAAGDETAAHAKHLGWCLATAAELLDDPDTDRGPWRAAFDAVADDLRAALLWVEHQAGQRASAHQLALRLGDLTYARGLTAEAQRRYVQAAELSDDDAESAGALRLAAGAAMDRHVGNDAMDLFRRAADLAERAGQRGAAARDLTQVAIMLTRAPGLIAELPPEGEGSKLLAAAWRLTLGDPDAGVDPLLLVAEAFHGDEVDPLSFDLANRAIELSRRRADPVAESAALDQLTAVHLAHGDIDEAAACTRRRTELLAPLRQSAALGMEVSDAYQMATETALGAGDLAAALRYAEQVHALPVYREEPHLGAARLLTVEALIGHWDRVIELSARFREGWERAGHQIAGNLALGASAVGMVHGLRGDEAQRAEWDEIVATLRASYRDQARSRIVFNPVFDAIVLVHRGEPASALDRLEDDPQRLREWFTGMWTHWYAAVWAEASVLDGHPEAGDRLARARWITAGNPVASAMVQRTEALAAGDSDRLPDIAAALDAAGCLYQSARTLALADGDAGRRGEAALAALGAAPMAAPTR